MWFFFTLIFSLATAISCALIPSVDQPVVVGDFQTTFSYIDTLITTDGSPFASLRSAWDACVHYSTVDATSTEQLFCAIAILRKALTALRRTLSGELLQQADLIEQWCQSLVVVASESAGELTTLTRSSNNKNKKKRWGIRWGVLAGIAVAGVAAMWWRVTPRTEKERIANTLGVPSLPDLLSVDAVPVLRDWSLQHRSAPVSEPVSGSLGDGSLGAVQTPADVLFERVMAEVDQERKARIARRQPPPGQVWVRAVAPEVLQLIEQNYTEPVVVHKTDGGLMLITEPTPEMKARLYRASAVSNYTPQECIDELKKDDWRARRRLHAWQLPDEGVNEFRQQTLIELLNTQNNFEFYVKRALSRDRCSLVQLYALIMATHRIKPDEWAIVTSFTRSFVERYADEISQRITARRNRNADGTAVSSAALGIESAGLPTVTIEDPFWVDEFERVCCPSLADALFLLPAGAESDQLFERILCIGEEWLGQSVLPTAEGRSLYMNDKQLFVRRYLITCLWSYRKMVKVFCAAYRDYEQRRSSGLGADINQGEPHDDNAGSTTAEGGGFMA